MDAVAACCGLLVSPWQQHDSVQSLCVFLKHKSPHQTSAGTYLMSRVGVLFTHLSRGGSVIEHKIIHSPPPRAAVCVCVWGGGG